MRIDAKVLVIAPDKDLRRSIAFLLEAEGYDVSAHATVPLPDAAETGRRHCAVVDEDATVGEPDAWDRLGSVADTIVLLRDRTRELPANLAIHTVEKPFLGQNLVLAVRSALLQRRPLRSNP